MILFNLMDFSSTYTVLTGNNQPWAIVYVGPTLIRQLLSGRLLSWAKYQQPS